MSSQSSRPPIRLGLDFGSKACRLAYVHPEGDRELIPIPVTRDRFKPCFPIAEKLPVARPLLSRFFPSIKQRLVPPFEISFGGRLSLATDIMQDLFSQAIDAAQAFTGRSVEGVFVGYPIWAGPELQAVYRSTLSRVPSLEFANVCSEAEAALTFYKVIETPPEQNITVLLLSAGFTGLGVAAARLTPKAVRILAEAGDQAVLAGNMLDFAIMQTTIGELARAGVQVDDDAAPSVWSLFLEGIQAAKETIRNEEFSVFKVPVAITPGQQRPLEARLNGPAFRDLVSRHMEQAFSLVARVLGEAKVLVEEIQAVLLVGGTLYLPQVVSEVKQRLGIENVRYLPQDSIAGGAALLAFEMDADMKSSLGYSANQDSEYIPVPEEVPGLVTLSFGEAGLGSRVFVPEQAQLSQTSHVPQAYPAAKIGGKEREGAEETPAEGLTIFGIREIAKSGDIRRAKRELERLRDAVLAEIRRLQSENGFDG